MADLIHRLHLKILQQDGSWTTLRTMDLPARESERGWTLRGVLAALLEDERKIRLGRSAPNANVPLAEGVLGAALAAGGVRVIPGGSLRHLPATTDILAEAERALRDGHLIPVLNGTPWKVWDGPTPLESENDLWFARSVWLQHF
jgi:hypothetical protein